MEKSKGYKYIKFFLKAYARKKEYNLCNELFEYTKHYLRKIQKLIKIFMIINGVVVAIAASPMLDSGLELDLIEYALLVTFSLYFLLSMFKCHYYYNLVQRLIDRVDQDQINFQNQ